jgi:hypothetical protein
MEIGCTVNSSIYSKIKLLPRSFFCRRWVRQEFNECKSSLKCCTKDGGRPSAIGMQIQISNRPEGAVFKRYGTEHLGKRAH